MRRSISILFLAFVSVGAFAQKTSVKIDDTQARALDVTSNAYVKPLKVELQVVGARVRDTWTLTREKIESLGGRKDNIRSYAVFLSSRKHDVDVIVAPTFSISITEEGGTVEVVGYPANFKNWATITAADYEWIRMEGVQDTSEREKINAVIRK